QLELAAPAFEQLPEEQEAAATEKKPTPAPRRRQPVPGPAKEAWEAGEDIPVEVAQATTKRISR
ncbi:MAG TPA: hypothetical protein VNP92_22855, partial [Actinophytocola sp.]|nr:hypothetical protein [Actinophytocola sp.]